MSLHMNDEVPFNERVWSTRRPTPTSPFLAILDGGLATHLEDKHKQDISTSPLWSASLLDTEDGVKAIQQAHLEFLRAGADIVTASSYQVSRLAYHMIASEIRLADEALLKATMYAAKAQNDYLHEIKSGRETLLSVSFGPLGAALANGSEYTGDYSSIVTTAGVDMGPVDSKVLRDFHHLRLRVLHAVPQVWSRIDLFAFETIPRLDEAIEIRNAMYHINKDCDPSMPAYISFVFPDGERLPYTAADTDSNDTNDEMDQYMLRLVRQVLGRVETGEESPITGIGINCTKPKYVYNLVKRMTAAVMRLQPELPRKPTLYLYPDGGQVWDGEARTWKGGEDDMGGKSWSEQVMEAAEVALQAGSPWDGVCVGGCCKSTVEDIAALRESVVKLNEERRLHPR